MARKKKGDAARRKKRFDQAMIDSTDLLGGLIADVGFPIRSDDFLVFELARLTEDYDEPSFGNEEFRLLVEQGIRLLVDRDVGIRARIVGKLRQAYPEMQPEARRIAPDVIGAIEDVDFPLQQVGAVVRSFTNQLFEKLEDMPDGSGAEEPARELLEGWKAGKVDRLTMFEKMRDIGPGSAAAVADMLFEAVDDVGVTETGVELLAMFETPVAARVLAYLVSVPILEEEQEGRAQAALKELWPMPMPYFLYNLKKHTHEDLPFRWFELLVQMDQTRAVERTLEEVAVHSHDQSYHEDLLAILSLLDRSNDPGVVGKILRLITDSRTPEATLRLMEEWLEGSELEPSVVIGLDRWRNGHSVLVRSGEDFHTFAAKHPDRGFEALQGDWNAAYHESLGWQQRARFPRGPLESEFDRELQDTMMSELSLNPRLGEAELREQIESFRENWLMTHRDGVIPLVAIYLERARDNPWLEEIYWCEINGWYVKAAQFLDQGMAGRARQYLDMVLEIEPDYPLARMLDDVVGHGG